MIQEILAYVGYSGAVSELPVLMILLSAGFCGVILMTHFLFDFIQGIFTK